MSTQIPPPEAGFSLTFKMIDDHGIENLITMRATSPTGWGKVLDERSTLVSTLVEKGWTTHGKPLPQASSQPASNGYVKSSGPAPEGYVDFAAEILAVGFSDAGKRQYKLKGGQFTKFGVPVYEEALTAMGVNGEKLEPGPHSFTGTVRAIMGEKGPKKVIGFAEPSFSNGNGAAANDTGKANPNTAGSMSDLVSPKQLGMIRALAREAGVDADEECNAVMGCPAEMLNKRAASGFIDHMKSDGGSGPAPVAKAATARGRFGEPDFSENGPADDEDVF